MFFAKTIAAERLYEGQLFLELAQLCFHFHCNFMRSVSSFLFELDAELECLAPHAHAVLFALFSLHLEQRAF